MNSLTKEQLVAFAKEQGITFEQAEGLAIRAYKRAEYQQRPEVVAKRKAYAKRYNQRADVKAARKFTNALLTQLKHFEPEVEGEEKE
jgi:hypothetical protein